VNDKTQIASIGAALLAAAVIAIILGIALGGEVAIGLGVVAAAVGIVLLAASGRLWPGRD
jgi:hypothetical protein